MTTGKAAPLSDDQWAAVVEVVRVVAGYGYDMGRVGGMDRAEVIEAAVRSAHWHIDNRTTAAQPAPSGAAAGSAGE